MNKVQEDVITKCATLNVAHMEHWQVTEIAVQVLCHYMIGKSIEKAGAEKPDGFDGTMQFFDHVFDLIGFKPVLKEANMQQDSL